MNYSQKLDLLTFLLKLENFDVEMERFATKQLKVKDAMLVTNNETSDSDGIEVECFKVLLSPPKSQIPQITVSCSKQNVIRGFHCSPYHKLVQCPRGKAFDVIVDLRPDSPTFMQWDGQWIDRTHHMLVPGYCGHGFFAAEDNTCILYLQGGCFSAELDFSLNYLDKRVNVEWPKPINASDYIVSPKDINNPFLDESMINKLRERINNTHIAKEIAPYSDFAIVTKNRDCVISLFEVASDKGYRAHLCYGNGSKRDTLEVELRGLRPKYGVIALFDVSSCDESNFIEIMNIAAICKHENLSLYVVVNNESYTYDSIITKLLKEDMSEFVTYTVAEKVDRLFAETIIEKMKSN